MSLPLFSGLPKDDDDWLIFRSDQVLGLVLLASTSVAIIPVTTLYTATASCWIADTNVTSSQAAYVNAACSSSASRQASWLLYFLLIQALLLFVPVAAYRILPKGGRELLRIVKAFDGFVQREIDAWEKLQDRDIHSPQERAYALRKQFGHAQHRLVELDREISASDRTTGLRSWNVSVRESNDEDRRLLASTRQDTKKAIADYRQSREQLEAYWEQVSRMKTLMGGDSDLDDHSAAGFRPPLAEFAVQQEPPFSSFLASEREYYHPFPAR